MKIHHLKKSAIFTFAEQKICENIPIHSRFMIVIISFYITNPCFTWQKIARFTFLNNSVRYMGGGTQ